METPVFLGASQQAACANEAANIVSSISGAEILTRGARDLVDVLQQIPGFTFGVNMNNEIGLGVRGIQADEGKMSVFGWDYADRTTFWNDSIWRTFSD